jgi:hypothetical protein
MNERIRQLERRAFDAVWDLDTDPIGPGTHFRPDGFEEKFAELIVRECCLALWTEECHASDLAFDEVKRNTTRIKEHFGIDPNEVTEDMLARSITWMEQQLADRKKHFGVEE